MEQNQCKMNEQQTMNDLLSTQKFLTGAYNSYCNEAATSAVRSTLTAILADEHRIQEQIFNEMSARGYYPLEKAEENKISSTKQKFAQKATV